MAALPCRHLIAALCVLLVPLAVQAQYTIEKIAFAGEPAPGGGTLGFLPYYVDLDEDGHVVFWVDVNFGPGESSGQIVAVHDGTSLQALVRNGDALPGGAGTLLAPGFTRIRSGGALAWMGAYSPLEPLVVWGAFRRESGIDTAIALHGQPAPGGGTFASVRYVHVMNAAHDVAFHANVDVGGPSEQLALFVSRASGLFQVMRVGVPTPIGGTFAEPYWPFRPGLAGDGSVAFWAEVEGGSAPHGLFRWTPGAGITKVIAPGDVLDIPDGGVVDFVGQFASMNEQGDICVSLFVLRPGDPFPMERIVVIAGTQIREVIGRGDSLPATGGIFLGLSSSTPAVVNASGDVAFAASIDHFWSWTTLSRGIFVSRDGVLQKVALEDEPVPGVPGATFADFDQVEMNDAGQIAFFGTSTSESGVFLAAPGPPPQVPLAPPLALGALAALIVAGAALRLGARRRHLAAIALLVLLAPARAPAQGYAIEKIAMEGDLDPEGREIVQMSVGTDLDENGRVAFAAYVTVDEEGHAASQVMTSDQGSVSIAVRTGDPVPGLADTFTDVSAARIAGDALVWGGSYAQSFAWGLFLRDAGQESAIMLQDAPAPGGGTFAGSFDTPVMNAGRDIAFTALIGGSGSSDWGLFLRRSTGLVSLVRSGDPAPAPAGGVFDDNPSIFRPGIAPDGTVILWSYIEGGSVPHGLFRWTPGAGVAPVLLPGDALQTPEGGTFQLAVGNSINAQGDVAMVANVLRAGEPSALQGVYVIEHGGAHRELIRQGEPLPGTHGHGLLSGASGPVVNAAGDVAFTAYLYGPQYSGVFVSRDGVLAKVALQGESVPGVPGATFNDFFDVEMNDAGQIVFGAFTTAHTGVFLATPVAPEVPLAPPLALGALAALLLATARRAHAGRR